ncbi:MAG: adenylate/guanylate cyclase domain-containing protein, partial [Gammaproteobacteria bacterium]
MVVLSTDVVGYSRLMGNDEAGTLATLNRQRRELIEPKSVQYHGRTVKLMGDGALMEFGSVVDAVTFAIEMQCAVRELNVDVPRDQQIVYRIGINIGDIIVQGDDIYGDGVNVAARLEGLAQPGGICVARNVVNQVKGKIDLAFDDLGEQTVKNVAEPIQVFQVRLDGTAPATPAPTPVTGTRRRLPAIAAGLVLSLIAIGGLVWWAPWVPRIEPASVAAMAFPLPDRPSIAVLPFSNMSEDASQEYFADGMTEDLITDLSKISGLFVIARNTTFTYKGQTVAPRKVAEDLGVRYILEGSVRRAGDQVRINAQLIDATTGGHLWAERYDGGLSDVFALQDRVTRNIVEALAISLKPNEIAKSARAETSNQEAYDAFLRGWAYYRQYTPRDVTRAIPHFERAIAVDPDYSRAYAALASIYWIASEERDSIGQTGVWLTALGLRYQEARNLNDEYLAQALRRPTPLAHQVASGMRLREGRF